MKNQFILLLSILFLPFAIVSGQTSDDSTKLVLDKFLEEVQVIKAETKTAVEKLENSISNATATSGDIELLKAKVKNLEGEVKKLKAIDSIVQESKKMLLKKRYDIATGTILNEIKDGVIHVKGLSSFVQIEQDINFATSPWSDKDIRDGYDKLKDWTPVFGVVGAGIPLLDKNSDSKTALLTGIGAMLIPQIISWIGKKSPKTETTTKKIASKIEFLNISRHAYDDLYQRKLEINDIYVEDSLFLSEIKTFQDELRSGTLTDSLMNVRIFKVQNYYNKFENIQNQIPKYLTWTKEIIGKYNKPGIEEIYLKLRYLEEGIDAFLIEFNRDFKELSNIPDETLRELFSSNL